MKHKLFLLFLFSVLLNMIEIKSIIHIENVSTTYSNLKNSINKGDLHANVSPKHFVKIFNERTVSYKQFGAKGDGKTDDSDAIAATHAFANQHGFPVKADAGATYYISGKHKTAVIRTNTDFGKATFIIDDTNVEKRDSPVFLVSSEKQPYNIRCITPIKKNQKRIHVNLPGTNIISVTNANVKHFIRFGPNKNSGSPQTDVFIIDNNGIVNPETPIIWDFDQITEIKVIPIDETTLTITGGVFKTIANRAESKPTYYQRGIRINRSNVIIDGLIHQVVGEKEQGAPYIGFINISNCAYVTVRNTILSGRKVYPRVTPTGVQGSMGSYDISLDRAINISFVNCSQTNDINDRTYWGIMGSNYCKNLMLDSCSFSRFDAHMGVTNVTIRNSTLGYQGINAIGRGIFTLENCTIYGRGLINLRPDYGSTWEGEFIIRNCVFIPPDVGFNNNTVSLFRGRNTGQHDFGYPCFMPKRIHIENLLIDDSNHPAEYLGPSIFADFNSNMTDDSFIENFPYMKPEVVILKNINTTSGKDIIISTNMFLFKDVKILHN